MNNGDTPNWELSLDRGDRGELNVLIRRPFYLNLRLGRTQNALWFARVQRFVLDGNGFTAVQPLRRTFNPFNWFPFPWSEYSVTFGRWSRRTVQTSIRRLNEDANRLKAGVQA